MAGSATHQLGRSLALPFRVAEAAEASDEVGTNAGSSELWRVQLRDFRSPSGPRIITFTRYTEGWALVVLVPPLTELLAELDEHLVQWRHHTAKQSGNSKHDKPPDDVDFLFFIGTRPPANGASSRR